MFWNLFEYLGVFWIFQNLSESFVIFWDLLRYFGIFDNLWNASSPELTQLMKAIRNIQCFLCSLLGALAFFHFYRQDWDKKQKWTNPYSLWGHQLTSAASLIQSSWNGLVGFSFSWLSKKRKMICIFLFNLLILFMKEDQNIKNSTIFISRDIRTAITQ